MFEQSPVVGPGTATLTSHSFEILLLLAAAFVLGSLLRYWLSAGVIAKLEANLSAEARHRRTLEADFDRVRSEHSAMGGRISTLEGDITGARGELAQRAIERDDALAAHSVLTGQASALRTQFDQAERTQADLTTQNTRLAHDLTACGAKQAELNAELLRLRALLDESAAKRLALETELSARPAAAARAQTRADDLKIVEGIGPKINELLNNAGIRTFQELAQAPLERLREILNAAGDRYRIHDPASWPEQAQLCASGAWEDLKVLQNRLTAGRA